MSRSLRLLVCLAAAALAFAGAAAAQTDTPQARIREILDRAARLRDEGQLAAAERLHLDALRLQERLLPPYHAEMVANLHNIGVLNREMGKPRQAAVYLRRALELRISRYGYSHREVAVSLMALAAALHDRKRYLEAEPLLRQALSIIERTEGSRSEGVERCRLLLSALHHALRDFEGAERELHRVLELQARPGPLRRDVVRATTLHNLAVVYYDQRRFPESRRYFEQAIELNAGIYGHRHPEVARTLLAYSKLLAAMKLKSEARDMKQRAEQIRTFSTFTGR